MFACSISSKCWVADFNWKLAVKTLILIFKIFCWFAVIKHIDLVQCMCMMVVWISCLKFIAWLGSADQFSLLICLTRPVGGWLFIYFHRLYSFHWSKYPNLSNQLLVVNHESIIKSSKWHKPYKIEMPNVEYSMSLQLYLLLLQMRKWRLSDKVFTRQ